MLITPHQVALHCEHREALSNPLHKTDARWTWIAGRRFRQIRRL
ncbi:MAG: hypothetical protein ABI200_07995 [Gaiellales bacterium]